jgi:hypothetical protein
VIARAHEIDLIERNSRAFELISSVAQCLHALDVSAQQGDYPTSARVERRLPRNSSAQYAVLCKLPRRAGGEQRSVWTQSALEIQRSWYGVQPFHQCVFVTLCLGTGAHWGAMGSFYPEEGHRVFMPRLTLVLFGIIVPPPLFFYCSFTPWCILAMFVPVVHDCRCKRALAPTTHIPPRSYHEFVSEIEYLQTNNFVDDATRAIFVDAVFYNSAFGLYTMVRLVFECFETGGVMSSSQVATFRWSWRACV